MKHILTIAVRQIIHTFALAIDKKAGKLVTN